MRNWHGNLSPFGTWSTSRLLGTAPAALFALAEPGVWLDPSDLPTLFRDTAGTQPVTTAGQTVALALDKSKGLVLGPELVTNGDFASGTTGWTPQNGATLSIVSGAMRVLEDGVDAAVARAYQVITTVVGRTYKISGAVIAGSTTSGVFAASPTTSFFGQPQTVVAAGTAGSLIFTATTTSTNIILANNSLAAGVYADFDNVSVRELAGNHATQSILASRPTYALHPSSGIRNLANGSADVGNNAFWSLSTLVSGITLTRIASGFDVDGLPYNDWTVSGTATANSSITAYAANSRTAAVVGQQFATSFRAQIISGSIPPAGCGVRADAVGETAPSTFVEAGVSAVFASTTEGPVSATHTLANAASNQARASATIFTPTGATVNYTIRIKALQFELGSARTNYQFNYANFNILEAPFAQVGNLLFDGIDDFLVTPTITPGTDKVQVFAGVRKQSDAARGMVAELGPGATLNRFDLDAPQAAAAQYGWAVGGSSIAFANAQPIFPSPDTAVLTGLGDISGDSAVLRRNGTQVASSAADQGTGDLANDIIYIGRRGGTTLPFNGRLYGLVVRFGPNLDAATIAATEAWMNTKTGAY